MSDDSVMGQFFVAHGGPFFELQKRLGLLHNESMRSGARAIGFVALAWGVPFLLSVAAGDALGPVAEDPYLLDLGA